MSRDGSCSGAGVTAAERINYEEEGGQRVLRPQMLEILRQGIESAQGYAELQIIKLGRRHPQERCHRFLLTSSVGLAGVFAVFKCGVADMLSCPGACKKEDSDGGCWNLYLRYLLRTALPAPDAAPL